tara:strand:- start:691 stop:1248 length:558 start_codon:yes stop_codon:yes gene_type:complete
MELHYIYHTISIIQSLILPYIADEKLYQYLTYLFYGHVSYYFIDTIKEYLKNESKSNIYIYHHIITGTASAVTLYNIYSFDRITFQNGLEFVTWADISSYLINVRDDYIKEKKINLQNDFIFMMIYTYCRAYKFLNYLYFFYNNEFAIFSFMFVIYSLSMVWLSIWYCKYIIRFLKKHNYLLGLY